jgi:hypothetical protein
LSPGTTTWFFLPVNRSGSKTKVVVWFATSTVASSRTARVFVALR